MEPDAESRWLLRWLGYGLIGALVGLTGLGLAYGWPASKVGSGFQLLGLCIAALGVPVVSPWLARVEVRAAAARRATATWIGAKRRAITHRLARLFRRSRDVTIHVPPITASVSMGLPAVTQTARGRVSDLDARELATRALDEVRQLRARVQALEEGRDVDRAEFEQRSEALRTELQRHVVSVTLQGWHYIVGGAGVTALGIGITLAA
jgi:hypothetical protein